ncbi:uncharacterized protein LOC144559799 [Carex rostrata]
MISRANKTVTRTRTKKKEALAYKLLVLKETLLLFEAAWRAVKLCDQNFGIGGDRVIFVMPGTNGADYTMRIFISDGSEPEFSSLMCCLVLDVR